MRSKKIDMHLEKSRILTFNSGVFFGKDAWKAAGRSKPMTESASNEDIVCATVWLKDCCEYLTPPATKHEPKTSNRFERMEPSIEACTTVI